MPIILLPLLLVVLLGVAAMALAMSCDKNEKTATKEKAWKVCFITTLIFIGGVIWWISYINQPWRYVNEQTVPVTIIDNKAIVVYDGVPYNINTHLHRQFKDGDKVSVKYRDDGFYIGLLALDGSIVFEAVE